MHVDPGALVTDVGHLEEERVQPGLLDGALEQGLVGPGGARSDHDTVQVVLLHGLLDRLLGIGGAGVLVLHRVRDVRQGLHVIHDRRAVHGPADVDTTVADEHADAGFLSGHVGLRDLLDHGVDADTVVEDVGTGLGGGAAGLSDGGRDVLGGAEGAGDVDTLPGGLQWAVDAGLAEAELVQLEAHVVGQGLGLCRRLEAGGQNDQVELLGQDVGSVAVAQQQVAALGLLDGGHAGPAVHLDAVFALGPLGVVLELLPEGPDVHEEYGGLQAGGVLPGDDGLLQGVHAADGRAEGVADLLVPGTDALDERDLLGGLVVGRPDHVSLVGTGGAQYPLELQAVEHVLELLVAVLLLQAGVEELVTRRENDRAHVDLLYLLLHLVVDGVSGTDLLAVPALALGEIKALISVNGVLHGHGLGVGDVDRLPVHQAELVLAGDLGRTLLRAKTAADASVLPDVPGLLLQGNREVTGLSLDPHDLGQGHHADHGVPRCLHKLWGQDAHRTVVGREGLVQLGHDTADAGLALDHVDLEPGLSQV